MSFDILIWIMFGLAVLCVALLIAIAAKEENK